MDNFLRNFLSKYSRILKKSHPEHLLKLLSAIEYAEAILEITASKLFSERFKWFIVFLIHLTKCLIRLQLLVIHKIGIQTLPNLFDVKGLMKNISEENKKKSENTNLSGINDETFFTLKHTGRIVRTIKNSPTNLDDRDWSLSVVSNKKQNQNYNQSNQENKDNCIDVNKEIDPIKDNLRFIAEILHIIRPLTHLSCIFVFNSKSWTQFFVPLILDSTSLFLINGTKDLSKLQKKELKRRTIILINYLMRSPFYEYYSSSVINLTLSQFEQRIPGMKFLIRPINEYIPYWRSIYNYCWAN